MGGQNLARAQIDASRACSAGLFQVPPRGSHVTAFSTRVNEDFDVSGPGFLQLRLKPEMSTVHPTALRVLRVGTGGLSET